MRPLVDVGLESDPRHVAHTKRQTEENVWIARAEENHAELAWTPGSLWAPEIDLEARRKRRYAVG